MAAAAPEEELPWWAKKISEGSLLDLDKKVFISFDSIREMRGKGTMPAYLAYYYEVVPPGGWSAIIVSEPGCVLSGVLLDNKRKNAPVSTLRSYVADPLLPPVSGICVYKSLVGLSDCDLPSWALSQQLMSKKGVVFPPPNGLLCAKWIGVPPGSAFDSTDLVLVPAVLLVELSKMGHAPEWCKRWDGGDINLIQSNVKFDFAKQAYEKCDGLNHMFARTFAKFTEQYDRGLVPPGAGVYIPKQLLRASVVTP
jgi:hypothetical protein